MKITAKFTTACTVGYRGAVSRDENRAAHGGVCHIQVRRAKDGTVLARKINSNGRHEEVGEEFPADDEDVRHWQALGAQER